MSHVGHLVGHHRAADTSVIGPAVHTGLEERPVHDQAAGGRRTGRAGWPGPTVPRTDTAWSRQSTASAGARRPGRLAPGSAPPPSPAGEDGRRPAPQARRSAGSAWPWSAPWRSGIDVNGFSSGGLGNGGGMGRFGQGSSRGRAPNPGCAPRHGVPCRRGAKPRGVEAGVVTRSRVWPPSSTRVNSTSTALPGSSSAPVRWFHPNEMRVGGSTVSTSTGPPWSPKPT